MRCLQRPRRPAVMVHCLQRPSARPARWCSVLKFFPWIRARITRVPTDLPAGRVPGRAAPTAVRRGRICPSLPASKPASDGCASLVCPAITARGNSRRLPHGAPPSPVNRATASRTPTTIPPRLKTGPESFPCLPISPQYDCYPMRPSWCLESVERFGVTSVVRIFRVLAGCELGLS